MVDIYLARPQLTPVKNMRKMIEIIEIDLLLILCEVLAMYVCAQPVASG